MTGFVEIAKELGIEDELFLLWIQKKLGSDTVKNWYSTTDLYVTLLGRHRRTFQAWEKQSGFPVSSPQRGPTFGVRGRAYTPAQVVRVLWWWWNNRAVERRGKRGGDRMASAWVFGCTFGLRQDDCGEYEKDEGSRGAGRFGGCASCVHRVPHNSETQAAENAWANK